MSSKQYKPSTAMRTARPRSARLRDLGGMGYPSSSPILVRTVDGNISEEKLLELQQLLDWFEFDKESQQIHAKYGLYTYGGLGAGGKSKVGRIVLNDHGDVEIRDPQKGESLVYDEETQKWINALIEGGEGGSATLENDITADVAVGNIKKGVKLTEGMTITEILTMMFSQAIINVKPTVKITNTPEDCEVGTTVIVNPSCIYTDGKYKTSSGEIAAGCAGESTKYYLEDNEIETPYTLETSDAKQHKVQVKVKYAASTANVTTASGEEYTDKIQAGTVTDEKTFIVGYRAFWGYMTDDEAKNLTPELVRGLEHRDTIIDPTKGKITLLQGDNIVPAGQDLMIVIPSSYILSEVVNKDDINFAENFVSSSLTVQCAGDVEASYNVYRFDNQSAYPMDIKRITIEEA